MIIRNATEIDLPAIVSIYNASIPGRMATADLEPASVESRFAWFQERSFELRPIWVMEIDSIITGWLSFQSFYGRPAYNATAEVSIYISPDHQKKGLASSLLAKAIDHSPSLGLETLLGFIFAHNYKSINLFEKYSFRRWGYLPKVAELDGVKRDLIIMGLGIYN